MFESILLASAKKYALSLIDQVDHYPYHNIAHTLDVLSRAHYLAETEGVSGIAMEDILIAAVFHDVGFAKQYSKNEFIGADIAEKFLRLQGVEKSRIQHIREIILTTILFSTPKDICGKIIQDADLDNLGRDDCFDRTMAYRRELEVYTDFDEIGFRIFTKNLLGNFQFHTSTQREERSKKQSENFLYFDEKYPKEA